MRSGDEPAHARSPLRLRAALAGFGLLAAGVAAAVSRSRAPGWVVGAFLVVAVVAAVDLLVVLRRLAQGAHYQPGADVPAYRPVDPDDGRRTFDGPGAPSERTRRRRYLTVMGVCLALIVLAWSWVRLWSTTAAVVMSAVAAFLPPVAVIIANYGVRLPPDDAPGPDRPPDDSPPS